MAKIMVIDDDIDLINLYKATLNAAGFEIIGVNQSSIAIETAYLAKPDIFLIDLMMPDIDGYQLCRLLRKDRMFNSAPIVIVTALTDMDSKTAAMKAGASDYVTKPFRMNELKSRITDLLKNA